MTTAHPPGPRADVDVRLLLLDTAERLFGDTSPEGVSLRAIAREAGVAPAALTYWYPAKHDLVAAVVQRRSRPVAVRMRELLDVLVAADRVTPRQVVAAVLQPLVDVLDADPVGGLSWMKLFARLGLDEDPLWVAELGDDQELSAAFLTAATRALPTFDDALARRTGIAMYSMLTALASVDHAAYGRPLGPTGLDPAWAEQLAVFTTAGMVGAVRPG
ncbi:TetR/AcrR family transcriptional regulator [Nocardioides sp. SYSU D00038]|uniref:TetR/AcrR family transcriptional regulator n=1 Tax=Nocardioides sp. SYSU D00038 TaxID=2812554 RepID=UPI0019689235|nr:TetR/AcrR family transcriptional regulator [Nocardioides sp. SYSU D00038]